MPSVRYPPAVSCVSAADVASDLVGRWHRYLNAAILFEQTHAVVMAGAVR